MRFITATILLTIAVIITHAKPFNPYGDNMVLQRSHNTKISGQTTPDTIITIKLTNGGKIVASKKVKTDADGSFHTTLNLCKYGSGYTLTIGNSKYTNVAVGEVWLLSGQSNMSWPLAQSNNAQTAYPDNLLRLMRMTPTMVEIRDSMSASELERLNTLQYATNNGWQISEGAAMTEFSGIGIFFAQRLRQLMPNVPIGLIQTSFGGTTAESFAPVTILQTDPLLAKALTEWTSCEEINEWCRSIALQNIKGATSPNQRHYFQPSYLYDARIKPLENYSIQGVLWYQGESNAENITFHERLFPLLVSSWRETFDNDSMPFYFVQLSSHNRDSWPAFRDSQRKLALQIPFCEMVVSHDYGNPTDVHPRDKKPIGQRLANIALALNYKIDTIKYLSPTFRGFDANEIYFDNTYGRLKTSDGGEIRGFEISTDGITFEHVRVEENNGHLMLCTMKNPVAIRYAWSPSTDANLVNAAGIPLSTFYIKIL